MSDIIKYKKIALKVRKEFEHKKVDKDKLIKLYKKYNLIENVESFVQIALKQFPKLNCGIASVYLQSLIKKSKVINGKYNNENHTFLLVDNLVVDITSDQYNGPKVYIGKVEEPWRIK